MTAQRGMTMALRGDASRSGLFYRCIRVPPLNCMVVDDDLSLLRLLSKANGPCI